MIQLHINPKRFFRLAMIAGLVLLFSGLVTLGPYGRNAPVAVGPYLNGVLPMTTPSGVSAWQVTPAFPSLTFDNPSVFTAQQNSNQLYVGSLDGKVYQFDNTPGASGKSLFLDISERVAVVWDGGFLGLAFHPEFGQSGSPNAGYFYVYYSARPPYADYPTDYTTGFFGTFLRLSRFTVPSGSSVADPNSEEILFNIRLYNGSHRGGGMLFGNDGFLYLSVGDQFRYETAQDIEDTLEGGVMRIDVDRDPARSHPPRRTFPLPGGPTDEYSGIGYYIPDDNPFLDPGGSLFEEYYTLGHRNPHRMTIDRPSGRIWIGEVGENAREEVNVVQKGGNYGWPFREGTIEGVRPEPPSYHGTLTEPVIDFLRSEANALIGGYVYRGATFPSLYGKYICGDYSQDRIWALSYDPVTELATKEYLCQFAPEQLATFGQDQNGEVYLCGLGQNVNLYQLSGIGVTAEAPPLLSQTGAFKNLLTLEPQDWLLPYDLNVPFWSDGATKQRWIAVPNNGSHDTPDETVVFSENEEWSFPKGTVLIKHFELPIDDANPFITRRLETRFMVHGDDGSYYGITYKWRPDGTEADLLTGGAEDVITVSTAEGPRDQVWHYPDRSECMVCHTAASGRVLGVKTRQLNRDIVYPLSGETANQLATWNHLDMFSQPIDEQQIPNFLTSAPSASNAPLEDRARAYIDINCANCHRPGTGNRAAFDARLNVPLASQNLIYGNLISDLGISGAKVIVPQDTGKSMLYYRGNSLQAGVAMPPLAKSRIDTAGIRLLAEWINSLSLTPPPSGQYSHVRLVADSEVNGGFSTAVAELNLLDGLGNPLNRSGWSISVNSEELLGENAPGTNAIDGNPASYWRSEWSVVTPGHPHQAVIDLGSLQTISALRYLPRQDIPVGRIADYRVYLSTDGQTWGNPVAIGTFPNTAAEQTVNFNFDGANRPPVVTNPGDQSHTVGDFVSLPIFASDPDGDPLTYSASGLPDGLQINSSTGEITGTAVSAGTYAATVNVSDGQIISPAGFNWTISPAGSGSVTILATNFDSAPDGFTYEDNSFRGANQADYAEGSYKASGGFSGGALLVELGGIDFEDIVNMSGAWLADMNLDNAGETVVSFRFKMNLTEQYEPDEYSQALLSVDGALYGQGGNDYLAQLFGGGGAKTTGWQQVQINLGYLNAGTHVLRIGGYNNQKTERLEKTEIFFDELSVSVNSGGNQSPEVNNPGTQIGAVGDNVSLPINASDPDGDPLTYSASGLPPGLSINLNTGVISGTLVTAGTFPVTVTVTDGVANVDANFFWNVSNGGTPIPLFAVGFDTGSDGFSYQDDPFRSTAQPNYASGQRLQSGGFSGGALQVLLGGVNYQDIQHMSGGWSRSFNLAGSGTVTVSLRYNLSLAPAYEGDEFSQVLLSADGVLKGSGGNDYIAQINGSGASGWQQVDINLGLLGAGSHLLALGGYNNKKTETAEQTDLRFDDVIVSVSFSGGGGNLPPVVDNPGTQNNTLGVAVSLPINATDPDGDPLSYSAAGLPDGLSINTTTGVISGTPLTDGTFAVTVTVSDGSADTVINFNWVISDTGGQATVLSADFDSDTDGFNYLDDTFRNTSQPSYASGARLAGGGYSGGGLRVLLGGVDYQDIQNISGGWRASFAVGSSEETTVSFRYRLTVATAYEGDEFSQVLLSVDGALKGSGGNDFISQLTGSGTNNTGWQEASIGVGTLAAGNHTLTIGGYNNAKTETAEQTEILFDDVTVTVGGGGGCPPIDFSGSSIDTYGDGQDAANSEAQNNGTAIYLTNNAWKSVAYNYTVTPNTVLSFEFRSTRQGEIHGIGLDDDSTPNAYRTFELYGTQNYGNTVFENYSGDTYKSYTIPVGQYYTGTMNRIFFVMDHDASPKDGNAYFRNIRIDEDQCQENLIAGGVLDQPENLTLPKSFALGQNYPNPFNPTTTIRFDLPQPALVSLKIYNLRGQLVRTLVNAPLTAGEHLAVWDAIDDNGHRVASGLYLYRLYSSGFTETRKMLLLK